MANSFNLISRPNKLFFSFSKQGFHQFFKVSLITTRSSQVKHSRMHSWRKLVALILASIVKKAPCRIPMLLKRSKEPVSCFTVLLQMPTEPLVRRDSRRRSSMFEVDPNVRRSHGDSIISMLDRSSIMDIKKKKNYQNTYKLEPDEKTPMNEAKQIINDVIKGF